MVNLGVLIHIKEQRRARTLGMWAVFPCANSFHYCFTAVMGPDRTAEGKGFGLVTPENPARSVLLSSTSNDDTIYVDISPVLGFLDYLTHNRRLVQVAVYFQDGFQFLSLLRDSKIAHTSSYPPCMVSSRYCFGTGFRGATGCSPPLASSASALRLLLPSGELLLGCCFSKFSILRP